MILSARDVAAEIRKRLPGVGTVKLHKLLYYAQGHHLATFGTPLFKDTISAWDMGPVVGSLWHAEREAVPADAPSLLTEAELNTVGYVISRYGALSGTDLRHLTHSEQPWPDANRRRRPGTSVRIPVEAIEDYFASVDLEDDAEGGEPLDADAVAAWLKDAEAQLTEPTRPDSVERLRARLVRDAQ
jgi:uncharacterized phage-associated protein